MGENNTTPPSSLEFDSSSCAAIHDPLLHRPTRDAAAGTTTTTTTKTRSKTSTKSKGGERKKKLKKASSQQTNASLNNTKHSDHISDRSNPGDHDKRWTAKPGSEMHERSPTREPFSGSESLEQSVVVIETKEEKPGDENPSDSVGQMEKQSSSTMGNHSRSTSRMSLPFSRTREEEKANVINNKQRQEDERHDLETAATRRSRSRTRRRTRSAGASRTLNSLFRSLQEGNNTIDDETHVTTHSPRDKDENGQDSSIRKRRSRSQNLVHLWSSSRLAHRMMDEKRQQSSISSKSQDHSETARTEEDEEDLISQQSNPTTTMRRRRSRSLSWNFSKIMMENPKQPQSTTTKASNHLSSLLCIVGGGVRREHRLEREQSFLTVQSNDNNGMQWQNLISGGELLGVHSPEEECRSLVSLSSSSTSPSNANNNNSIQDLDFSVHGQDDDGDLNRSLQLVWDENESLSTAFVPTTSSSHHSPTITSDNDNAADVRSPRTNNSSGKAKKTLSATKSGRFPDGSTLFSDISFKHGSTQNSQTEIEHHFVGIDNDVENTESTVNRKTQEEHSNETVSLLLQERLQRKKSGKIGRMTKEEFWGILESVLSSPTSAAATTTTTNSPSSKEEEMQQQRQLGSCQSLDEKASSVDKKGRQIPVLERHSVHGQPKRKKKDTKQEPTTQKFHSKSSHVVGKKFDTQLRESVTSRTETTAEESFAFMDTMEDNTSITSISNLDEEDENIIIEVFQGTARWGERNSSKETSNAASNSGMKMPKQPNSVQSKTKNKRSKSAKKERSNSEIRHGSKTKRNEDKSKNGSKKSGSKSVHGVKKGEKQSTRKDSRGRGRPRSKQKIARKKNRSRSNTAVREISHNHLLEEDVSVVTATSEESSVPWYVGDVESVRVRSIFPNVDDVDQSRSSSGNRGSMAALALMALDDNEICSKIVDDDNSLSGMAWGGEYSPSSRRDGGIVTAPQGPATPPPTTTSSHIRSLPQSESMDESIIHIFEAENKDDDSDQEMNDSDLTSNKAFTKQVWRNSSTSLEVS